MQHVMNILSETSAMIKLNDVKQHYMWVYINTSVSCIVLWWMSALVWYTLIWLILLVLYFVTDCCIYHITSKDALFPVENLRYILNSRNFLIFSLNPHAKLDASSIQGCLIFEVIWYIVWYQEIVVLARNCIKLPGIF